MAISTSDLCGGSRGDGNDGSGNTGDGRGDAGNGNRGSDDHQNSGKIRRGPSGLSNIFANAARSAPADPVKVKSEVVVKCRHCGAPQTQVRVFVCSFCGGSLA